MFVFLQRPELSGEFDSGSEKRAKRENSFEKKYCRRNNL